MTQIVHCATRWIRIKDKQSKKLRYLLFTARNWLHDGAFSANTLHDRRIWTRAVLNLRVKNSQHPKMKILLSSILREPGHRLCSLELQSKHEHHKCYDLLECAMFPERYLEGRKYLLGAWRWVLAGARALCGVKLKVRNGVSTAATETKTVKMA